VRRAKISLHQSPLAGAGPRTYRQLPENHYTLWADVRRPGLRSVRVWCVTFLELLGYAAAEDLRDFVSGDFPEAHLAGALEDFVNREIPFKNEIAAEFDLLNGVEALRSRL
jgi:hypothetical protein